VDEVAAEFLRVNEIRAVPVIRAGDEIIIGFDEPRLKQVLGLVEMSDAHDNEWLAAKYELVLDSLVSSLRQVGPRALDVAFAQRKMSVRAHILHIVAFAEGGYAAHECGTFDTDDMFAATARADRLTDVDDIGAYVVKVRDDIATFLRTGAEESHERVVLSHYGGEVTVVELLRIMLRHSTHHLRQLHRFMEKFLLIVPSAGLTEVGLAGIVTPDELFEITSDRQQGRAMFSVSEQALDIGEQVHRVLVVDAEAAIGIERHHRCVGDLLMGREVAIGLLLRSEQAHHSRPTMGSRQRQRIAASCFDGSAPTKDTCRSMGLRRVSAARR